MSTTTDEFDPHAGFVKIREKAKALGITDRQLASLESLRRLKVKRCPWIWPAIASALSSVVITLLLVVIWDWPIPKRDLTDYWFEYSDMDMEQERCLLELSDYVIDLARPPVDCSMCADIKEVDRVKGITPEEFEAKYAYTGTPVVITDGTRNWTAVNAFSFDFFKEIYSEGSPALENVEANCQFFPYKTDFGSLGEVFEMSKERAALKDGSEPWYIGWSNCDSSVANQLRTYYTRPYFLPRVAESSKLDWIFMGSPGYGAHMHIDCVGNPSWQAQIVGTKLWTLEPPPECYHICEPSIEVIVNPGDMIVLDTNRWFHSTLIKGDNMSITIGSEYD